MPRASIGPANGCNGSGMPRASVGPANGHCNLLSSWFWYHLWKQNQSDSFSMAALVQEFWLLSARFNGNFDFSESMVDIHLLFWSVGYPKEQLDVTHSEILEMNEGTQWLSIYIQTCQKLWTPNFQVAQECHIWLRSKFEIACKVWHVKIKIWMVKKIQKIWNPFKALH